MRYITKDAAVTWSRSLKVISRNFWLMVYRFIFLAPRLDGYFNVLLNMNFGIEFFSLSRFENRYCYQYRYCYFFHVPYYINISEVFPHIRKSNINYLIESIKTASKLKVNHITLHIGNFYWFPVEQWNRKRALKRFLQNQRN